MFCGAELIDNQNFPLLTQSPEIKQIRRSVGSFGQRLVKLFREKKKTVLPVVLIGIVLVAGFLFMQKKYSAKSVAENYFLATVNADPQAAYPCLDIVESDFTDKTAFENYWTENYSKQNLYNYTVKENTSHGYDGEENGITRSFTVEYYLHGQSYAQQMGIIVVKADKKKLLLIDEYKVLPDFIVTDYCIVAPTGSTVLLDDREIPAGASEGSTTQYPVDALFYKQYTLEVRYPLTDTLYDTVVPYSGSGYTVSDLCFSAQTRSSLFETAQLQLQEMVTGFMQYVDFPADIQTVPDCTVTDTYYSYRGQMRDPDSGVGYYRFDFTQMADVTYDQWYDSYNPVYQCEINFDYTYGQVVQNWFSGNKTDKTGDDNGSAELTYRYLDGQWLLQDFSFYY